MRRSNIRRDWLPFLLSRTETNEAARVNVCRAKRATAISKTLSFGKIQSIFLLITLCAVYTVCSASPKEQPELKVLADGTMLLRGMNRSTIYDFRGATSAATMRGPVGLKGVVFGDNLYVFGERNRKLLAVDSKRDSGNLTLGSCGIESNPNDKAGGWSTWYGHLPQVLARNWSANIPGQVQVVLQVNKDGTTRLLQTLAFIPGKDKDGVFATPSSYPNVDRKLVSEIQHFLSELNKNDLQFPAGSSASSVKILVSLISDKDMVVALPNLSQLKVNLNDSRQLELLRIATIFETGFLYPQADLVRPNISNCGDGRFIPENATHRFVSTGKTACFMELGSNGQSLLTGQPKRASLVDSIITFDLKNSRSELSSLEDLSRAALMQIDLDAEIITQLKRQDRIAELDAFQTFVDQQKK